MITREHLQKLSYEEKIQIYKSLLEIQKAKARKSFSEFITYTMPNYQMNWHHRKIIQTLEQFLRKEIKRLMIYAPPRVGKSQLVSRHFPAFLFGQNPDAHVIACSYGAELASAMNRDVQRIIQSPEYKELFPETLLNDTNVRTENSWLKNSDVFEIVNKRGKYRSAGVGGAITGHGADFAIIDDPIKNQEEANSKTYRDKIHEWYQTTLLTRVEQDGCILLTLTRWHEDDLAGRLLQEDDWTVLTFPAIAEEKREYDPREIGEALWPEKYSLDTLLNIKKSMGSYYFGAMYQQQPAPKEGNKFRLDNFQYYRESEDSYIFAGKTILKSEVSIYQTIDPAGTESVGSDYFAAITFGITRDSDILVLDIFREKLETTRHEQVLENLYRKWKPRIQAVENKTFGINIIQNARRSGRPVLPLKADKSKELRAEPLMVFYENKKVFHPESHVNLYAMEQELLYFPNSKHDDMVDCLAYAAQMLRLLQTKQRQGTNVEYIQL